ncbi:hypothetical protein V6B05_01915 [Lactococcus garvieae]|uniref:hypothetical protein n=1 Tax=Lactococcus garvieae TaxID=1363 RepID=UPI001F61FE1B|nr:hypothetical protein [Lactococcus garvieae]MCI3860182.1 hypothetical protein [Lactococcus garvieae]
MAQIFSDTMEAQILERFETKLDEAMKKFKQNDPWEYMVTRKEICEKFNIKDQGTIKNWEGSGLKRCEPPFLDTKTIVYDKREVAKFLGFTNW